MYYHSDSFHNQKPDIEVEAKLMQIDSIKGLKAAIAKWKASKRFTKLQYES